MKIICTKKDTGKRLLIDTIAEPGYKSVYNNENGNPFNEVEAPVVEPVDMIEVPQEMIKGYQCGNCGKKYKTLKGIEKHLKKCK